MKCPSFADSFEVLCLQAADNGRADILFGDSLQRVRTALRPFMVGKQFPSVYLEFPLAGEPFLDVTVLFGEIDANTRIPSEAASGTEDMLDWYSDVRAEYKSICCGFELDTKNPDCTAAAVHFQPRSHVELVAPFCEAVGEPQRAPLYLDMAKRMPESWPLSFFGMFRGRPGSPLRVCGYLPDSEKEACAKDPGHVKEVFDTVGFSAYNETMLTEISELMAATPGPADFQFDVYDDGSLGSVFAIDAQFAVKQPEAVFSSFTDGGGAQVMNLLERWGVADKRWRTGIQTTFARAIPAERDDGSVGRFAFTLMPNWVKARWKDTVLQPSKLYLLASAGFIGE